MRYYLQIDDAEPTQIASNKGYDDLCRWADTLPVDRFGEVVTLTEHGLSQDVARLRQQLAQAAQAQPPAASVLSTVRGLVGLLEGVRATVVTVTDGVSQ